MKFARGFDKRDKLVKLIREKKVRTIKKKIKPRKASFSVFERIPTRNEPKNRKITPKKVKKLI